MRTKLLKYFRHKYSKKYIIVKVGNKYQVRYVTSRIFFDSMPWDTKVPTLKEAEEIVRSYVRSDILNAVDEERDSCLRDEKGVRKYLW